MQVNVGYNHELDRPFITTNEEMAYKMEEKGMFVKGVNISQETFDRINSMKLEETVGEIFKIISR